MCQEQALKETSFFLAILILIISICHCYLLLKLLVFNSTTLKIFANRIEFDHIVIIFFLKCFNVFGKFVFILSLLQFLLKLVSFLNNQFHFVMIRINFLPKLIFISNQLPNSRFVFKSISKDLLQLFKA